MMGRWHVRAAVIGGLVLAPLSACLQNQAREGEVVQGECLPCHGAALAKATRLSHDGLEDDCATCHTTKAWWPAVGGHQAGMFPLRQGAHQAAACAACHVPARGADQRGANTNCFTCHPRGVMDTAHAGHADYAWLPQPNFCLRCHPTGRLGP